MDLADKLLWDLPINERHKLAKLLRDNPVKVLEENESLFIKALNSLTWYELIELFGPIQLDELLTDSVINKVFPQKRRKYYQNARRLLSKKPLSTPG